MYVALGDSISIDSYAGGPGRGGPTLLARNRDDDFPDWSGRDLATIRPDLGFVCSPPTGARHDRYWTLSCRAWSHPARCRAW